MFYDITFGNRAGTFHTWTDWKLFPTTRPLISVPEAKTNIIDIPGGCGGLDVSQVLCGDNVDCLYGLRTGSWEFIVCNPNISIDGLEDYVEAQRQFSERKWKTDIPIPSEDERPWIRVYTDIMENLHGRKTLVRLSDDPDYRYLGRIKLNEWRSEEKYSVITLDYTLQPFKFLDSADPEKASISRAFGGTL